MAIAGVILAGCASGASAEGGNTSRPEGEIHVLVLGDAAASAEQAAADRFNETSDVKVVIDTGSTSGAEYSTAVRNSIGTASAPDIFMSWGAANIAPLVDAGALMSLNDFIDEDPKLESSFLPSVFSEEVVDGESYGIPMRGVAPTFLYYNKQVLADAGLEPATTWDELLEQVAPLTDAGVTPIGLAGSDKWPTQMWYQYVFDRVAGPEAVREGLLGDGDVWDSDESREALDDIKEIVDSGAFGNSFDSVTYGTDGSAALLRTGKSAYELMGTWHYATIAGGDEEFVKNDLGWTAFPSIGSDNATDIAGNLSNFYNVAADTRYPDTVRDFLAELYSDEFLKDQLALGNLPPTKNAADLVAADTSLDETNREFLTFVAGLVADAPAFQLSWDQFVPAASQTPLQNAMADYFNGTIDADGWVAAVQSATAGE
ncbi:ABC transporter substrate-binding protein [Microbacterium sp. NPDC088619]|uniref:ABC transporter substrate-binding protein n=1 Tax=Microbacterium sp. NPDC088619 TaxID=3364196 RepID=UPI00382DD7E5